MGVGGETNGTALLDLALADPALALTKCDTYLANPTNDVYEHVTHLRARGLANRLLGDLESSALDLETGLELATTLGDMQLRAGVALTFAGTRVFQGDTDQAKAILLDCIATTSGEVRAEAIFQLGTTHGQAGESEECLGYYAQALPLLRRYGRRDWESNLLGNRGIIYFWAGDFTASIRDLDKAIYIQQELGIPAQAAINMLNKAQALYMMGELAGSLDLYREAEEIQDELGMPVLMHAQKIETYLAAGMFEDCLALSQRTHQFHRQNQMTIGQIRSLLPGAEAALALGQNALARRLAQEISGVDGADNFGPWIDRAELTRLEATVRDSLVTPQDKQAALTIHAAAVKTHTSTALRALLIAANVALVLDDVDDALELLEQSLGLARRSPLHLQIQRWRLVATARREVRDQTGTLAAVRAGLRSFDRLLAGVTSYDTRVRANRHADGLAEIGVRELMDRRRFGDAVQLTQRLRSGSIRSPKLTADEAQDLIAADTKLRTDHPDASPVELLRLQKMLAQDSSRSTPARAQPAYDESLLTWVEVDETLFCLHGTQRSTSMHRCGSSADVDQLVDDHQFLHRQLARRKRLSPAAVAGLIDRQVAADAALAASLMPPRLRTRIVLNPPVQLSGVVWGSLSPLAERPHVVAPSLAITRRGRATVPAKAAVFGSSELAHILSELNAVAPIYGARPHLDPDPAALVSINGADIVHLAGHFVADGSNPLFSGIPLGAEHLRGIDYLRLQTPPTIAVLSACASAETESIGGTAIGFVTAALTAGTRSVVATQTLIEDDADTVATMQHLHQMLAAGTAVADALVMLRASATERSFASRNLVVYGAGW